MKKLTNKNFIQKIVITILIIMSFNIVYPTVSRAGIGGILLDPLVDLVTSIGDTILSILQSCLYNGNIGNGLSNILNGNAHFMLLQSAGMFQDMLYDDASGKKNPVKIDSSDFDTISLFDIGVFLVNIPAGFVNLGSQLLGLQSTYDIPTIQYTTDKIFSGQVPAFDVNYINPKQYTNQDMQEKSVTEQLQSTIKGWYNALKNLATIGLLSVLLYVGIRMVISSVASDKAKYKQMLIDWVVALCLVFFLHYIMAFTMTMIDILNESISNSATSIPVIINNNTSLGSDVKFNTDLMGLCRLQVQYSDFGRKLTYLILYIGLLVYTVRFTWVYMKRTITMAFLTLIAPLVALTYPIDKINDGKAQAFNSWLKEYIFTALLQPFHLIIYTILLGSAMNIVTSNPLYAIFVLAFMGPAETMLRKFFGFDKASTPNTLSQAGAAFGGAAAFNLLKQVGGGLAKKAAGGGKGDNIRTNNKPVESDNAPSGYDAFTNRQDNSLPEGSDTNDNSDLAEENFERNFAYNNDNDDDGYGDDEVARAMAAAHQNDGQQDDNSDLAEEIFESQYGGIDEGTAEENIELETNSDIENQETPERIGMARRMINARNAARAAAANYIRDGARRRFGTREATMRTLKSAAKTGGKFVGRMAVAGAVGAIGLGMGIAGNDLEDVLKYGGAGTGLGYATAPGIGRRIANSGIGRAITSGVREEYHGGVNAAQIAAQTEEQYKSGNIREEMAQDFPDENGQRVTGEELDKLEDRGIELYNNGFTDRSERKKVMKMEKSLREGINKNLPEQEREDRSKQMAETIGKIAKDIEPGKLSNDNYVNGKINEFKAGIKKANPDLDGRDVDANAKQMMTLVKQYYKKP